MGKAESELIKSYYHTRSNAIGGMADNVKPHEWSQDVIDNNRLNLKWEGESGQKNAEAILIYRPDLFDLVSTKVNFEDVDGAYIGSILMSQPQLVDRFSKEELNRLTSFDLRQVLPYKPQLYSYFKDRDFDNIDKIALIRDNEYFADVFPEAEMSGKELSIILSYQPQLIERYKDQLHKIIEPHIISLLEEQCGLYKYFTKEIPTFDKKSKSKIVQHCYEDLRETNLYNLFGPTDFDEVIGRGVFWLQSTYKVIDFFTIHPHLIVTAYKFIKTAPRSSDPRKSTADNVRERIEEFIIQAAAANDKVIPLIREIIPQFTERTQQWMRDHDPYKNHPRFKDRGGDHG